jgi:hypothetical protein
MLWANRNGIFMCWIGRLVISCWVNRSWSTGPTNSMKGRPNRVPGKVPTREGALIAPGNHGTNWYSPSFSPQTGCSTYVLGELHLELRETRRQNTSRAGCLRGAPSTILPASGRQFLNFAKEDEGAWALRAIDPKTGEMKWEFKMTDFTDAGF